MVLGEEGEHRAGALTSGGHVVLLQGDLLAVVADGVEVQVESGLPGIEADLGAAPGQAFEQGHIGAAPDAIGVAGEVGGFGDGHQPEGDTEPGVGSEGEGVGGPAPPAGLEQQQRPERVERAEHSGGRVAGRCDQPVEAELGHGRHQQEQPGVVARPAGARRPVGDGLGLDRFGARWRAGLAAPVEAFEALGVQDGPHRLG